MQVILWSFRIFVKRYWKSTYKQYDNLKPKTAYLMVYYFKVVAQLKLFA